MDKYEKFLTDIIEKTARGSLKWDVAPPSRFHEYVFQAPLVYSAYEAEYQIGGVTYILGFIEKKSPSNDNDYDVVMERHRCEMIVITESKLIFTLDGGYVDYDRLLELGRALESKNLSAEALFANFGGGN